MGHKKFSVVGHGEEVGSQTFSTPEAAQQYRGLPESERRLSKPFSMPHPYEYYYAQLLNRLGRSANSQAGLAAPSQGVSNASSSIFEQETTSMKTTATLPTAHAKKSRKTEVEKAQAELAIDGTGLLDPRKSSSDMLTADEGETGRMRTRQSGKEPTDAVSVAERGRPSQPSPRTRRQTFKASKHEQGREEVLANYDEVPNKIPTTSGTSSSLSSPLPSTMASRDDAVAKHTIPDDGDPPAPAPQAPAGTPVVPTTTPASSKPRKRSRPLQDELATSGTPLLQESLVSGPEHIVKEYLVGTRWWRATAKEARKWKPKPTKSRTINIFRDSATNSDETSMRGRPLKKRKLD